MTNKQSLFLARASILDAMIALNKAHTNLVAAAQHLETDERTVPLAHQVRIAAGIAKGQAQIADVFRAQVPVSTITEK